MGSRRGGWGEVGGTATAMGVDGFSIGVKRLPEIGDDGGDGGRRLLDRSEEVT